MTKYQMILSFMVAAFIVGSAIGSFLNVCIARMPHGESVVSPRSRCPKCGQAIRWYQNIPILSYFLLRGRCAGCQSRISIRYPLVELLTGVLFSLVLWYFSFSWATPIYWVLVSMLVVITFIDLDHQIIPNVLSLPGIALGFLASFLIPWITLQDSLIGIVTGGGSLWLVAIIYQLLTRSEGMGMGDVKLLAMIGAFLGYKAILPVVLISSLLGTVVGVPFLLAQKQGRRVPIPFGPFLSMAALVMLFWGDFLVAWYFSLFVQ